jgi:hypothetical protein
MVKRGVICYASVFPRSKIKCSMKSMELQVVDFVYACSCSSVFIIISHGTVKYYGTN